jgi:hypothetical protein
MIPTWLNTPATIEFCEHALWWGFQPANTISNLAFVFVGIYILRKDPKAYLGRAAIILGICSGLFHGTSRFAAEYLDLASMFLISTHFLRVHLRAFALPAFAELFFYLCLGTSCLILFLIPPSGIFIFAVHVGFMMSFSLVLTRRMRHELRLDKNMLATLGFFALAFIFWCLDYFRIWCNPDNHFVQGHALWHILNSLAIYQLYLYTVKVDNKSY